MAINDPYDHWKMDESPSASSAANSGSNSSYALDNIAGNADFTTAGLINNGAEFTGNNSDRMYATGNWDISSNDFSVGCFFKADDYGTSDGRLITMSSGVSVNNHEFMLSTNNTLTVRVRMRIDGSVETLVGNNNVVTFGKWHHVVATYSSTAGDLLLYLDTVEIGSDTTLSGNFGVSDATRDVGVGNTPGGTARVFDGIIDDVRTFDRALSTADIEEWYRLGLGGEELMDGITIVGATELTDGKTIVNAGAADATELIDGWTVVAASEVVDGWTAVAASELVDGLTRVAASELIDGLTRVPAIEVVDGKTVVAGIELLDGLTRIATTELADGITRVAVTELVDGVTVVPGNDAVVLIDGITRVAASELMDGLTAVATTELVDGLTRVAVSELVDGITKIATAELVDGITRVAATEIVDGKTIVSAAGGDATSLIDGLTRVAVTTLMDGKTVVATAELVDGLTLVAVTELVDGKTIIPDVTVLHNINITSEANNDSTTTSTAVAGVTVTSKV